MNDQYVLVTRHAPADGEVITHAYGPFPTRDMAARRREALLKSYPNIEATTCKVLIW